MLVGLRPSVTLYVFSKTATLYVKLHTIDSNVNIIFFEWKIIFSYVISIILVIALVVPGNRAVLGPPAP